MWIIAEYLPTTLFSLRPATATTSGGKSLLTPTAFAIKMAILDAAIRTQGLQIGKEIFPVIRDLKIAIGPPSCVVVNRTFMKILRIKEIKTKASEKEAAITRAKANQQWPFQRTIAYREFVQFNGSFKIALQGMSLQQLVPLLAQINYFGKRGSFFQLLGVPSAAEELPGSFTEITTGVNGSFPLGTLQLIDDCGSEMTFDRADVYNSKGIRMGKDRILHHVILPYRLTQSSRGYSLYQRLDARHGAKNEGS